MSFPALDCLMLDPQQAPADSCIIWLHGLGASNRDFLEAIKYLDLTPDLALRFCFPQAPERPVTLNGGYIMPSWYDILGATPERQVNHAQLAESVQGIKATIQAQIQSGLAPEHILLAGFSQGGALAMAVAQSGQPLAGLILLSTYAIDTPDVDLSHLHSLVQHGLEDDVVIPELGQKAHHYLTAQGSKSQWKDYPMDHSLCLPQLKDIGRWINSRLKTP